MLVSNDAKAAYWTQALGSLLDEAGTIGLHDRHVGDFDDGRQRAEDNWHVALAVHDSGLYMVVGAAQLVSQERAVLEVVVGLNLAVLEVVGNQQHLHHVVGELLTGDEVEHAGGGLAADAVVDDTSALALLGGRLVHGEVCVQDAQDVGRHADTEVAVGDVPVVLHLQCTLVQEGDELTLQPLEVAVGEVGRSLEGELTLELMPLVQALLQPLVLHPGGDYGDVLSHRSHDVSVGKVLDAVLDIGAGFLGQAHLNVGTGGHDELLEVVAEAGIDGMSVLGVRHSGIEVYLLDTLICAEMLHHAAVEVQLAGYVQRDDIAGVVLDLEHAGQGVGLGIEVGNRALGHTNLGLVNRAGTQIYVDSGHADIAVNLEQRILALHQRQLIAACTGDQTLDESFHRNLGTLHEGDRGIGCQSIDEVLSLGIAGGLDDGDDLFDFHGLLLQRTGVEQAVQHGLIGSPHRGGNGGGKGNGRRHQRRLVHCVLGLRQVVHEDLSNGIRVLLQHVLAGLGKDAGIMLAHEGADLVRHILDFNCTYHSAGNALIADASAAGLQLVDNGTNVTAFRIAAKQNAHSHSLLS